MVKRVLYIGLLAFFACLMSGCGASKITGEVASLPFKALYETGKLGEKGTIGTTKLIGKGMSSTAKMTGKGLAGTAKMTGKGLAGTAKITGKGLVGTTKMTGKSVYFLGKTPVHISKGALDTSVKTLQVSAQVVTAAGMLTMVHKQIKATELDAHLMGLKGAKNVTGIFVKAAGKQGKKMLQSQGKKFFKDRGKQMLQGHNLGITPNGHDYIDTPGRPEYYEYLQKAKPKVQAYGKKMMKKYMTGKSGPQTVQDYSPQNSPSPSYGQSAQGITQLSPESLQAYQDYLQQFQIP